MQTTQNYKQRQQDPSFNGARGSANRGLAEKLVSFYERLSVDKLDQLSGFYSSDIVFIDPVTSHSGLAQLRGYFASLLEDCISCDFEIHELEFNESDGWIRWTMSFKHPRLKAGQKLKVEGMSMVKITGDRITYQRDFYDMGEMIYENLPLLGGLIKYIRRRIA